MAFKNLLNAKATIYNQVETVNATNGEKTKTWTIKHLSIPCRLDQATGEDFIGSNKIYTAATHVLYIDDVYSVVTTDRVKISGKNYNVLRVSDGGGALHHTELLLEYLK